MFYSHEVLTSRKYGVATIWLVATLGAKSTTKKVTRKAILDVDLEKACETIMEPEAPMALRLQSNLLYGVTRVYNQKWDYLVHDARTIQTSMRTFLKTMIHHELDMDVSKTKPEQLLLPDDPAFLIRDIEPPPLEPDLATQGDSQRSSQSMLSVRGRSKSVISNHSGSAFGINLPSSSHGGEGSYQLPDNGAFRNSIQRGFGEPDIFNDDEQMILNDDDLFDIDANGNLIDIPTSEREVRISSRVMPKLNIGSDSAASGRVRKEHEDGLTSRALPSYDAEGDLNMINFDEGVELLPEAEPFPAVVPLIVSHRPRLNDGDFEELQETSSISAAAPARRKKLKAKSKKKTISDQNTELSSQDMKSMIIDYVENMEIQTRAKIQREAGKISKKNAFHFVFGSGLNGVGNGVGLSQLAHPLVEFSGQALFTRLTGIEENSPARKRGTKRVHSSIIEGSEVESEFSPSKRAREAEVGRGNNYEYGDLNLNAEDDQQYLDQQIEQSIELGRDAASALQDYPSSARMPWNVSTSAHSHQRGQSSSIKGQTGVRGSRRLTSASPLMGRGSALPGELEHALQNLDDEMVMYGRSDNDDFGQGGPGPSSSQVNPVGVGYQSNSQHEDFELFGAAAGVDTQTAGTSQWAREALDKESNNFFEFVKNTISEKQGDELIDGEEVDGESVVFDELFDPEKNSAIVAAQAFYHVLSLATKSRIWVDQYGDDNEIGGEIRIGIMESVV